MNIRGIRPRGALALCAAMMLALPGVPASAQFDARQPLAQLISAFQNCGPPQVYQMLSPQLFQLIAAQTNGAGCYADVRAAGPITNMQVIDQRNYPVGPMFAIRVTHASGTQADWFIGINQYTQRVEYLNYQAVSTSTPPPQVNRGPSNPQIDTTMLSEPSTPAPSPGGGGSSSDSDGCEIYPVMCQ